MNHDELESIYQQYYTPLFLFALSLTQNKEDAEDLVANTFVKAFLSFEKGNLKAWLYTVLRNEFYTMYKRKSKIMDERNFDFSQLPSKLDVLEEIIHNQQKQWLYKQIYQMKPQERNVLLLSIQKDLKDSEIAEILNLNTAHVRVIKNRAKTKLIELSKKEDIL